MTAGVTVDFARIQAEIHDEVRRRRAAGDFPPGLERELDQLFARYAPAATGGDFDEVIERAERTSFVHADVPTLSNHRALALVKRSLRTVMAFYVRFLAQQVTAFAGAITRAVQLLARRVEHLEQVTVVAAERALAETEGRRSEVDVAFIPWVVGLLRDVDGRVLHIECGDGAIVAALTEAGADAYGVDPSEELAMSAAATGLDVRADDPMTHLRAVPDGALAAAILTGIVDRWPVGAILELLDVTTAKLAPGGRVVVLSAGGRSFADPVVADLAPGRPLHPDTWRHLLQARRYGGVDAEFAGAAPTGLDSLPPGAPGAEIHNANVARLNAILFASPAYGVTATRPRQLVVAVHQLLPVFAARDAIGNHTTRVRRCLQQMGIESEIIAGEVNPGAGHGARSIREVDGRHGLLSRGPTWLLYHASTGSAVADWFAERPEAKLIDYHNITPAETIGAWEPHVGVELEHGRRQLAELAGVTTFAFADSAFNEQELIGLGYRQTAVVPILLDTATLRREPDAVTAARLAETKRREGGADWLFVSRVLPHKAQHDLIKAFATHRRAYDAHDRLHLVGPFGSARYVEALRDFVEDLGLDGAVHITGSISDGDLGAYYRAADVYVSLSDHEGFAVPLLEAMANGVPVVAFGSSAVPETAGDAALVLETKDAPTVAAAVRRVLGDDALRAELVRRGHDRLGAFSLAATSAKLKDVVAGLLAGEGIRLPR